MVLPFPPPPPFPSHITINKWLLPFLLPYHYQILTSRQFCATTRTRAGSWCFRRPISVAMTTERRSSWPCRKICIPGGAFPRMLAACCSLTFASRVIRSLLRLLLSTATCGPCRRASLLCRTRLVWFELHCVVVPTTNCSLHVLLSMRQHLLTSLWGRLPHQQGPSHVERARHGVGAAAVDITADIQQVSA